MELMEKFLEKNDKTTQLKEAIKSLQFRRESLVTVVQNEISILQQEKQKVFIEVGEKVYSDFQQKKENTSELVGFWEKIQKLETQIDEKEGKKNDIIKRYDEEISMLQKNINLSNPIIGKATTGGFCPGCGTAVGEKDMFCEKCGTKLK